MSAQEGDNLITLKEFKRQKRLKQKQRKKQKLETLKLEQPKLNSKRVQRGDKGTLVSWQQLLLRFLGYAMALVDAAIITRNALSQGDNSIDQWIAVSRDLICVLALSVLLDIMRSLWSGKQRMLSLLALCVWSSLGYYNYQNQLQWTHSTTTNATIERLRQRKAELENDNAIALLKEAYSRALANEREVKANEPTLCKVSDSTACKRFKAHTLPGTIKASEEASATYSQALATANRQAEKETTPVAPMQSLIFRTFLPMLGGIFVMLGTNHVRSKGP
jgi:hypothetical protein